MVTCPSIDTPLVHPSLLGCVPLNTFDFNVLYDNGESGIEPTLTVHLINVLQYYSHLPSVQETQSGYGI